MTEPAKVRIAFPIKFIEGVMFDAADRKVSQATLASVANLIHREKTLLTETLEEKEDELENNNPKTWKRLCAGLVICLIGLMVVIICRP